MCSILLSEDIAWAACIHCIGGGTAIPKILHRCVTLACDILSHSVLAPSCTCRHHHTILLCSWNEDTTILQMLSTTTCCTQHLHSYHRYITFIKPRLAGATPTSVRWNAT